MQLRRQEAAGIHQLVPWKQRLGPCAVRGGRWGRLKVGRAKVCWLLTVEDRARIVSCAMLFVPHVSLVPG